MIRKTTEEFIKEAKSKHGDKYDYSKVEYKNTRTKVIITCPVHGDFEQLPASHSQKGRGCRKCASYMNGLSKMKTQNEFINEVTNKYGDRFDYSKVVYNGCFKKVDILCRRCGTWFLQTPNCHLKASGCMKCARDNATLKKREKKNNTKKIRCLSDFLKKAKSRHGDRYDYSKVTWGDILNCRKYKQYRIKIICPVHGIFHQRYIDHISGCGCQKCAAKNRVKNGQKITTYEFITRSKKVHGDKYDYSKSFYINQKTKLTIICKLHGEFLQSPCVHWMGRGCKVCGEERSSYISRVLLDDFVNRARELHGDRYDYSKIKELNGLRNKVCITCRRHGDFWQVAWTHIRTNMDPTGCPKCTRFFSIGEQQFLSFFDIPDKQGEFRQVPLLGYYVDGKIGNTVFEFLGDFWHGNPNVRNPEDICPFRKESFRNIFQKTFNRFSEISSNGYKVLYVWEQDWINFMNGSCGRPVVYEFDNGIYDIGLTDEEICRRRLMINNEEFISSKFLTYNEACIYMAKYKLRSLSDFNRWKKDGLRPSFIPSSPRIVYVNSGFSWNSFLGYELDSINYNKKGDFVPYSRRKGFKFVSYEEAKLIVSMAGIHSKCQFRKWKNRPPHVPSSPSTVYSEYSYADFYSDNIDISKKELNLFDVL